MEYSEVDSIHEDFKKGQEKEQTVANQLPAKIKLFAFIACGVVLWYFGISNDEWKKALIIVGAILGGIYMWGTSQDVTGKSELTDLQLRTLLWKQLRYYQLNPFGSHFVIPDGEIRLMPTVARWTVGENLKYRTYSICLVKRNNLCDYYAVDVNIYTGDIVKIQEGYFSGKERPHIKYIESEELTKQKRLDKVTGSQGHGQGR